MQEKVITVKRLKPLSASRDIIPSTLAECASEAVKQEQNIATFPEREIAIEPPQSLVLSELKSELLETRHTSLSSKDVVKVFNQLIEIISNPYKVASLLKSLDDKMGQALKDHQIGFDRDDLPEYLLIGRGHYIPGPPPQKYCPRQKGRLLDELLLEQENRHGLNPSGAAPKFIGFVDGSQANQLVAEGHLFTEHKQISRVLLHGSYSHRLIFHIILLAIDKGMLDLTLDNGEILSARDILNLLVDSKYYQTPIDKILQRDSMSLWELLLDNVADMPREDYFNPANFSDSCRSPFVLNSLLLCFGRELGLPNLQQYLLDSHWKAAYEMVMRIKESKEGESVSESQIYSYCMEILSSSQGSAGSLDIIYPFALSEKQASKDESYQPFVTDGATSIVRKKEKSSAKSQPYGSWGVFFEKQKKRHQKESVMPSSESTSKMTAYNEELPHINNVAADVSDSVLTDNLSAAPGFSYEIFQADPEEIKTVSDLLKALKDLPDKEGRLDFLNQLGAHRIQEILISAGSFVSRMSILQRENAEVARDLIGFLIVHNGLTKILETHEDCQDNPSVYQALMWTGSYDESLLENHIDDLQTVMQKGYDYVLQMSLSQEENITLIYDKDTSTWTMFIAGAEEPIKKFSSSHTLASELKKLFAIKKERVKISTQLHVHLSDLSGDLSSAIENIYYHQFQGQCDALANPEDRQVFAKEQMRALYLAGNELLCRKLIDEGLNFFSCELENQGEQDTLFNNLCEYQAKHEVLNIREDIFSKDWEVGLGGRTIGGGRKVPHTVAEEWKEIQKSEKGDDRPQTYHDTLQALRRIRQTAAGTSSLFRSKVTQDHYSAVTIEPAPYPLRVIKRS